MTKDDMREALAIEYDRKADRILESSHRETYRGFAQRIRDGLWDTHHRLTERGIDLV